FYIEAGFLGHRLHHLRELLLIGVGRRHQCEGRIGHTGLGEQCFGARDVTLRYRNIFRVETVFGRHPLVADGGLAVHRNLYDAIAIERQLESLTHPWILAQRILLRELAFAYVDRDPLIADLGDLRDLEPAVGFERRHVRRRHALDEVELAGFEIGEPHRGIHDRQVHDLLEMDLRLVPVIRITLEHNAVLRDALDEAERSRAHRLRAELVAFGLGRLGRDHHSGAVGELREERRERCGEIEPHRHRVHYLYARNQCELAATVRPGHVLVPLEVELDRRRVQLFTIVESDSRSHLDRERLVIGGPLISGGELRDDVELLVDVEKLVAQRGEYDASDEGARQCRIDYVRI